VRLVILEEQLVVLVVLEWVGLVILGELYLGTKLQALAELEMVLELEQVALEEQDLVALEEEELKLELVTLMEQVNLFRLVKGYQDEDQEVLVDLTLGIKSQGAGDRVLAVKIDLDLETLEV